MSTLRGPTAICALESRDACPAHASQRRSERTHPRGPCAPSRAEPRVPAAPPLACASSLAPAS
eukprot:1905526-Prymnesium_polylepis.1